MSTRRAFIASTALTPFFIGRTLTTTPVGARAAIRAASSAVVRERDVATAGQKLLLDGDQPATPGPFRPAARGIHGAAGPTASPTVQMLLRSPSTSPRQGTSPSTPTIG